MNRAIHSGLFTGSFVSLALVTALASSLDAAPRRFRRASYSNNYTSSSGGIKQVAPTAGEDAAAMRSLAAYYSYDKAMDEEVAFTDRVRVFVLVRDEQVRQTTDPVVAEVKLTDLNNSRSTRVRYCPVTFTPTGEDDYQLGVFDVANEPGEEATIEPAKIYRLFVNLHRKSEQYGEETALGQIAAPYYVATAGDNRLDRARQHIAMRTFKEYYYAKQGWPSGESYPMDCYAYYMWATGSCTVGAQEGRTILGFLFGGRRPFQSGGEIPTIAQQGPIHGDYVRIPGHSFMLLAYDRDAGHVWTMEGNFNSTIEVVMRSVDAGWTIGHLVEEHVRPGLFEVSRAVSPGDNNKPPL